MFLSKTCPGNLPAVHLFAVFLRFVEDCWSNVGSSWGPFAIFGGHNLGVIFGGFWVGVGGRGGPPGSLFLAEVGPKILSRPAPLRGAAYIVKGCAHATDP